MKLRMKLVDHYKNELHAITKLIEDEKLKLQLVSENYNEWREYERDYTRDFEC